MLLSVPWHLRGGFGFFFKKSSQHSPHGVYTDSHLAANRSSCRILANLFVLMFSLLTITASLFAWKPPHCQE